MRRAAIALVVVALLAGCGGRAAINEGGKTPGQILTVYALVPDTPAGTDFVRGAKLALSQAGGRVGPLTVQFASARPAADDVEGVARSVQDIVRDTGTIAVIGDLEARTARTSGPLLNAVGLLHVSPLGPLRFPQPAARRNYFGLGADAGEQARAIVAGARGPFAVESEPGGEPLAVAVRREAGRLVPTPRARTVVYAGDDPESARGVIAGILRENRPAQVVTTVPVAGLGPRVRTLGPDAAPPGGFGAAFPGVAAGPYAGAGHTAMNAVLAALRRAGDRAQERREVIRAFRAPVAPRLVLR